MSRTRACVCSVVSRSYLGFARAWARSINDQHDGDVDVLLCVVDGDEGDVPEGCGFVPLDELEVEGIDEVLYRYGRHQLVVSSKAPMLRAALRRGYRRALFMDVDTFVFARLDALLDPRGAPISITPHLVRPRPCTLGIDQDLWILQSGTFNGGCIAVSAEPAAEAFLDWFATRLATSCEHDIERGLHVDQTWLDLVPGMFDGVGIHRDPGWNVAYWNLHERPLERRTDTWFAGGSPLTFFHFSGFDPRTPQVPTRYRPELDMTALGGAAELFDVYVGQLAAESAIDSMDLDNGLAVFRDGARMPRELRRLVDEQQLDVAGLDPRLVTSAQVRDRIGRASTDAPAAVWLAIWNERRDLKDRFAAPSGDDRLAFDEWVRSSGPVEYPDLSRFFEE